MRGIAGRHERRESGRDDEDPLDAMDYGYLRLDGTEDDDDENDEVAQNKLLILVAKDVKTGTYAATCLLEIKERVSMPRHGWCPCCVDLAIAERYGKVMESHRP